jgi:chaperonin GroEL
MAAKQLSYAEDARQKLLAGASKLARAVRSTLGPRGRNAILDKGWGSPNITKDGVTVAEDIELSDPFENMGAQLVKEAASKTSDVAGDGTTTATVLAEHIFREGLRGVAAGHDPMALVRGIQAGVDKVVDELHKIAEEIDPKDTKSITEVATIAANNDREIGQKLADAMKKVGANGVITIEEGKIAETQVNVVQGMQFDRGYLSPHFVNNQESVTCEFDNPYILIFEEKISSVKTLIPLLEWASKQKEPLLLIAEDFEGEALATLVLNKLKGILQVCAVKAPGYGDRRKAMLEDIAVLTGGKAIFKDLGVQLDATTTDSKGQLVPTVVADKSLGRAKKVRIDAENTTITEGKGDQKAIDGRAELIRKEIEKTDSEYDREKLQERLAKLAGGVAVVKVGGATETAMKERKALYEDSLHATRAAIAEGIVPGGGVALLNARKVLDKFKLQGDEAEGLRVLYRALEMPTRLIAENAGLDGTVVVSKILKGKDKNFGYNADTEEYGDLRKAGVIDPVKVTRSALQNGASVASLLLTTEAIIADIPEPKKPGGDHHHDHDHGGGMGGMGMGGMGGMGGMM